MLKNPFVEPLSAIDQLAALGLASGTLASGGGGGGGGLFVLVGAVGAGVDGSWEGDLDDDESLEQAPTPNASPAMNQDPSQIPDFLSNMTILPFDNERRTCRETRRRLHRAPD